MSYRLSAFMAAAIVLAIGNALAESSGNTSLDVEKTMVEDWTVSGYLALGWNSGKTGILNIGSDNNAYNLTVTGNLIIGHQANGELFLNSGTVSANSENNTRTIVANNNNTSGLLVVNGGTFTANKEMSVGESGTGTMTIDDGGTVNAKGSLYVGKNGTGNGMVNLKGGTLTVAKDLNVANGTGSVGSFNGTSGKLSLTSNGNVFNVGFGQNSTGTVTMDGGDWSCYYLRIGTGSGSTGSFVQNGGSMTVNTKEFSLGLGADSEASYTLNGGTLTFNNFGPNVGCKSGSKADFNIMGGSATLNGNNFLTVGRTVGSTATMTVGSGGKYTSIGNNVWGLLVGWDAPGTLNIAGGEVETRILSLCNTVGAANSEVNITDGGVLAIDYVKYTSNTRSTKINIDGGKVKRRTQSGVSDTFLDANENVTVSVGDNGAEFDANGYDIAINEDLENKPEEAGKVRFSGGGTITLGGANSYTGGTTIELGTKVIASSETAKDTVVGKLIVDGTKYLADTSDIVVFEYGEGGLSVDNVEFKNCGDGTKAKVSDDRKQIIVDFVARSWATVSGDTKLSALIEAAGGAPASDAIVGIKMTGNYTLTIDTDLMVGQIAFSNGGSSTLLIDEGVTLKVNDITGINKITNNGKLVKTGEGTVALPFDNASTGETVVEEGTLKVGSITGSGSGQEILVQTGATFDVNGKTLVSSVTLEGGSTLANTSAHIGNDLNQTKKITLLGDATVNATKNFGLCGNPSELDLGSYTLSISGGGSFWLYGTKISGTGEVYANSWGLGVNNTIGEYCTISVGPNSKMAFNGNLSVKDFVNGAGADPLGSGILTVKGELMPGSKAIPKLTLANGATIKATGTAQVVSTEFSASGTIYVNVSAITKEDLKNATNERIPVLTVPVSFNKKGVNWVAANSTIPNVRVKWGIDEGGKTKTLFLCRSSGTMIIVR